MDSPWHLDRTTGKMYFTPGHGPKWSEHEIMARIRIILCRGFSVSEDLGIWDWTHWSARTQKAEELRVIGERAYRAIQAEKGCRRAHLTDVSSVCWFMFMHVYKVEPPGFPFTDPVFLFCQGSAILHTHALAAPCSCGTPRPCVVKPAWNLHPFECDKWYFCGQHPLTQASEQLADSDPHHHG